ncbi:MAG: sigma-54 interaction domain-containing protein [Desulfovermiculus sp.]
MTSEQANSLMLAFSGSYDGLVLCDADGVLVDLNESYRRITEASEQDVKKALGRPMQDLVEEGMVAPSATVEVLRQKKTVTLLQRIKTGKKVLVTSNPLFDGLGRLQAVVSNVRNPELFHYSRQLAYETDFRSDAACAPRIIAQSAEMNKLLSLASRVAPTQLPVLLLGESGTGKDLVARFIHEHSDCSDGPFIPVNCAAIHDQLFEAELFGYKGGAFTGASRQGKQGLVSLANRGTLFLDEVAEMPMTVQAKLLRFLQDMSYFPVGGTSMRKVDVRVICASNQDLGEVVAQGKLRDDLYYRIAGILLTIPALRERRADIRPLARHFSSAGSLGSITEKKFSSSALRALESYAWPGNVRQLQNAVQRLHAIVAEDEITAEDVCCWIDDPNASPFGRRQTEISYQEIKQIWDKETLQQALKDHGSIRAAARALKVSPSTILRKKRKYGL